ncbi:Ribosome-binding factor A [bioreactor metagenome]|uniref:Ribosome-binding factor A n=1 Tax=bioreactor metagenome TaxID=1076179 RepID=A0A644T840_9ZZZZ|nr:ribosome-binding factor A [Candidatus Elulimicrobiales bacterium]
MKKVTHEIEDLDFAGQTERQVKIGLQIRALAQDFFQKESSGVSLITVTKADISRDLERSNIYITVLPESKEAQALSFAKRMRSDLRTVLKNKLRIRKIPNVEIKLDEGEKARQIMDTLLREKK